MGAPDATRSHDTSAPPAGLAQFGGAYFSRASWRLWAVTLSHQGIPVTDIAADESGIM